MVDTKEFYMSLGSMIYYIKQVEDESLKQQLLKKLEELEKVVKGDE